METKQKPREEAAKRQRPAPSGERRRPRPEEAPAQNVRRQNRPAEDSRKKAARSAQQQKLRPEQERRRPPAENAEKPKRPAGQQSRPAGKSPAAPRKRTEDRMPERKPAGKRRPAPGVDPGDISNKKRAYGKSKPKKKSAVVSLMESIEQSAKKSAEKKKKSRNRQKQPAPAVIYTQPAAFNRNRLIVQLITVTAVVLALVIGLSVFFKVEHIYVSGTEVYSESSITEVCGISKGDNLLTFSHARSAALIQANRPYVREVRFGIKLPDTVNIIIEEDDVVYAVKDQTGQWWLMNSSGRVVEQGNNAKVANKTQVLGVTLENPVPNEKAIAMENAPAAEDPTADSTAAEATVSEVIPVTTTGAQRLDAALQILKALENNDIVGSAASVDVSRIDDIILWYGTRYQVNLGDNARLDHKVACMNAVIAQMSEYQSGILDCSFTIWPNQVGYTPFS